MADLLIRFVIEIFWIYRMAYYLNLWLDWCCSEKPAAFYQDFPCRRYEM